MTQLYKRSSPAATDNLLPRSVGFASICPVKCLVRERCSERNGTPLLPSPCSVRSKVRQCGHTVVMLSYCRPIIERLLQWVCTYSVPRDFIVLVLYGMCLDINKGIQQSLPFNLQQCVNSCIWIRVRSTAVSCYKMALSNLVSRVGDALECGGISAFLDIGRI